MVDSRQQQNKSGGDRSESLQQEHSLPESPAGGVNFRFQNIHHNQPGPSAKEAINLRRQAFGNATEEQSSKGESLKINQPQPRSQHSHHPTKTDIFVSRLYSNLISLKCRMRVNDH